MVAARFNELTLNSAVAETADAVILTFDIPEALRDEYAFTPGQYLTLRDTINGQDVRRSYSICSPLGSESLSVGVKRIEGGVFSSHALTLIAGQSLQVMTPQGRFLAPIGGEHDYLLLAAGSGITPMVSIARSVLENEPNSTVTLCYANRSTDSVMFRTAFEDLKDQYLTRFMLTHVMDEEIQDIELFNGRLDGEKLDTMATRGLITPKDYSAIYICGPQPMIQGASTALEAMGVDKDNIKYELFTPAGGTPVASSKAIKVAPNADASKISVTVDGSTRSFSLIPGEKTVEAAAKAGVEFPYSCDNGMCATCRCKLVKGDVEMTQNFSLEQWEIDAGFVLACQVQAKSNDIKLDFDAI
jgi:ring-1,2-phenylacetyl-CoA epoxidase subunit PaaE